LKNKIAYRRLGHSGPEDMRQTPSNVYAVDCDDVNSVYDTPKGHSYFRSGRKKAHQDESGDESGDTLLIYRHDEVRP